MLRLTIVLLLIPLHADAFVIGKPLAVLSTTRLENAISIENLSCSHDGGANYQLNDVSYVLPKGGKIGLV
jgi:hypothetical protein